MSAPPWERQPGEPNLWYERFDRFRAQGPRRSVLSVYNAEREKAGKGGPATRVPGAWDDATGRWRWRARAEAWDAAERERRAAEEAEERRAEREQRLTMLRATRQVFARRLQEIIQHPAEAAQLTPAQLVSAMATLFGQQRIEYGEDVQRVEVAGPGGAPIRQETVSVAAETLSPEIAARVLELRRLLAGEGGSGAGDA